MRRCRLRRPGRRQEGVAGLGHLCSGPTPRLAAQQARSARSFSVIRATRPFDREIRGISPSTGTPVATTMSLRVWIDLSRYSRTIAARMPSQDAERQGHRPVDRAFGLLGPGGAVAVINHLHARVSGGFRRSRPPSAFRASSACTSSSALTLPVEPRVLELLVRESHRGRAESSFTHVVQGRYLIVEAGKVGLGDRVKLFLQS